MFGLLTIEGREKSDCSKDCKNFGRIIKIGIILPSIKLIPSQIIVSP
jgi:hypothetical protein